MDGCHGGGLGFAGDIIFGGRYSFDPVGGRGVELLGPTFSVLFQALDLTAGSAYKFLKGQETNMLAKTAQFLSKNAPGQSAWYMRLVLERYLFEYMQELTDPKYQRKINRKKRRTKKDEKNSYWWEPGDKSPQSAPSIFD